MYASPNLVTAVLLSNDGTAGLRGSLENGKDVSGTEFEGNRETGGPVVLLEVYFT